MAVLAPLSVCLGVLSLEDGIEFYIDAGLQLFDAGAQSESLACLRGPEQERDCVVLLGGAAAKRRRHVSLRADPAQDVIAFCCARKDSEHPLPAFAKSPGVGFHRASFQVNAPDEVGRSSGGLLEKAGRRDCGFGRHAIHSNIFHSTQPSRNTWFKYYSDTDHIDDESLWTLIRYGREDSLANWGPAAPRDVLHNRELDHHRSDRELA